MTFVFCLLACPASVHAESGHRQSYYARQESVRRGSEIVRFAAAATFVHDRLYSDASENAAYLCSIKNLLPENRGAGFLRLASERIAVITGLTRQSALFSLTSGSCDTVRTALVVKRTFRPLRIDAKGRVVSKNPVWNACIRGEPLTAAIMRTNPDVHHHRQGRIIVKIPLSCRDYHRGELRVWRFPDDPSVELVLDKRGRLLGDAPPGFVMISP